MKRHLVVRATRSKTLLVMGVIGLIVALVAQLTPGSGSSLARGIGRSHQDALELVSQVRPGGKESPGIRTSASSEAYNNRAYPNGFIAFPQTVAARKAFDAIQPTSNPRLWQEVGPFVPQAAGFTGRNTTVSGRETALAVAPDCAPNHNCRVWVGAAGGGIWRTDQGLAPQPQWFPSSNGLTSNAIGSIVVDPTDPTDNTLYVGTGEGNAGGDSEAGVGLFKSTDGGRNWSAIAGSLPYSNGRAIMAVAVDPVNSQHIFMGTSVGSHGWSATPGRLRTPPNSPTLGLYESWNGGATWSLSLSLPQDSPSAAAAGVDGFAGGITKIELDRTGLSNGDATRVFTSVFDYGLYRRAPKEGDVNFRQVFASAGGGSLTFPQDYYSRTEFSLAPMPGNALRIYLGDTDGNFCNANFDNCADFYRTDVGLKPGLFGAGNPGPYGDWTKLSDPTPGTPGFGSFNFCGFQCSYDMPVFSPRGYPDIVYIGGQMQYSEIFTPKPPSNGRAVQRSDNAGTSFTDMTRDTQSPPEGMHPDQHWMAFVPNNPNIGFFGSDGGLVRINGTFSDRSGQCYNRGLSGPDLTDCLMWLKKVPDTIYSLNAGLRTLQYQSVSLNPQDPLRDLLGGTQDNGTWNYYGSNAWTEVIGGDGGQSGIDLTYPNMRIHTYYGEQGDVNFNGSNPVTWDWVFDPIRNSLEGSAFYIPLIADPRVSGTIFAGAQHVWRTQDWAGPQSYLDQHCNEITGDFSVPCGDWVPVGQDLSLGDPNNWVAALARTPKDSTTLWAATRFDNIYVSKNANVTANSVTFDKVDNGTTPNRLPTGIVVDSSNPNHAWISYNGYTAYAPGGHVYEALYNPTTHTATFTDISYNIGDMPLTGIERDQKTGDLYAATDFGVLRLPSGSTTWEVAANALPPTDVASLTLDTSHRVLYAATHGRGIFRLYLAP